MIAEHVTRALFIIATVFFAGQYGHAQAIKVTLLGTGCPAPVMNRFGPSILVEAGAQKFVFDAGRGAVQRLAQAKVRHSDIDGVFLTHLHSDHVVGFPDLWLTGWVNGKRDRPLKVWGPKGTEKMMSHLEQAYDFDIKIRLFDDRPPPKGVEIEAKDITEGVIYEKDGVKITAFLVDHRPVTPALGYRIDHRGRSVVLSGDTRPSDNLVKYSMGSDLLIHEVVAPATLRRAEYVEDWANAIIDHHTTPEQAGALFSRINPRMAVYSHIVLPSATEADLLPPTRKNYSGPLVLGEDLMAIEIGDTIVVRRPAGN